MPLVGGQSAGRTTFEAAKPVAVDIRSPHLGGVELCRAVLRSESGKGGEERRVKHVVKRKQMVSLAVA